MLTKIYIKNMVCPRCIASVKRDLEGLNYKIHDIKLGEVSIEGEIDIPLVKQKLEESGFELLEDKNTQIANKIKSVIVEIVHHQNGALKENLSQVLTKELNQEYSVLSNIFSSKEGITIERYYILQRIEKVKELLEYNQLSLKEMAFDLGFSSVAHLSAQFKKETGLSPKQYKDLGIADRKPIHKII